VLVEKPMAATLEDGLAMVAAAESAGTVLLVGHSHSHDPPIVAMRELIASGELGPVRMVNTWCFTDWVRRPRRPDELDATLGGGVTFRQGAHQFDILRLLCGGRVRSVRAHTFDWDPSRRVTGAHIAFLEFDGGAAATAVYNGYGGLAGSELGFGISEWGFPAPPPAPVEAAPAARVCQASRPTRSFLAKQRRAGGAIPAAAPHQPFFGLTIVSCERGDVRQSPDGCWCMQRVAPGRSCCPGASSTRPRPRRIP
jgi:phthalate 4,5-cis-dihydrodiol dehydrogenase